jgi:hypothetical protein
MSLPSYFTLNTQMLTVLTQYKSKWKFSDVLFKQRDGIEFLTAEKVLPTEIHRRMQAVYGDQCVDVSTIRSWVKRFKDGEVGQADVSDKTRSERPVTAN